MFSLPSSSPNPYPHTEANWNTYDSKNNGYYHPNTTIDVDRRTILDDERLLGNNKHQLLNTEGLQTLRRKINKQKTTADRRTEQSSTDHMFESSRLHNENSISSSLQNIEYSTHRRQRSPFHLPPTASQSFPSELDSALRHSTNSRTLHDDNDTILTNGFERQDFHQPNTRKVTKITPKENYSLSNSRPTQVRSASASTVKHESKDSSLTPSEAQRLRHVRRHEPAHVQSGPGSKTSLITPDSWRTDPVIIKKPQKKKPVIQPVSKQIKLDDVSKPIIEQLPTETEKIKRPKRDTSASKPSTTTTTKTEKPPVKPPPKHEKTKEEKEEIKKYIDKKRHKRDENLLNEKKVKNEQEKERKDKLKKLNEQIKKVAQLPLPPSLIKKSSSSTLISKDSTEQTRQRLLDLLGPKAITEPSTEHHTNTPFEQPPLHERSSSSSSSSSDSIVEIQPPKINDQTVIRSRSEPPVQNGVEQRHHNLLRWAVNITQDCNVIENKFKYSRPDGTQAFDIVPSSRQHLQHDDGNLRLKTPVFFKKKDNPSEPIILSKIVRPSGRLSHLNQNRTSEYQGQQLPGVGDLRDPMLERRVRRDRAAAKIQAAYRGYTVRKSLQWNNEKQNHLKSEFNKRPIHKPSKMPSYKTDLVDTPSINLDIRFSDDNFTIGSTLLRHYKQNGTNHISSTHQPIVEHRQQQKIQRPTTLQTYSDDYENITSTISSTPSNHKQLPQKPRIIPQPVSNIQSASSRTSSSSTSSSSSTTPTPTPEPRVISKIEPRVLSNIQHRRSISPPLPPQMSPDNGRPIHYHPQPARPQQLQPTAHRIFDERRYSPDALERQLNAELHLLDGVEASMKQVENMERLRSVALAQQEVVSLAQVLQNRPSTDTLPQKRRSTARQTSSSSASSSSSSVPANRKHRSPSPPQPPPANVQSRHRTVQPSSPPSSSSSESTLTVREKRVRQKFHNENELQAHEKRLKDIEKKIHLLIKRENNDDNINHEQMEVILNAYEIFDEKRTVPKARVPSKSSNDSSISEDIPVSHKSLSSISSAIQRKSTNDTSEIRTETIKKDSDSSSVSVHRRQSDTITSDASDIERRIRAYRDELKTKKSEFEKLKQKKNKEELRRQEDELKKQLQTYDHQIETLRVQPTLPKKQEEPKIPAPTRRLPLKSSSSSSSSSISTATKPLESSIAEDLPVTSTASQPKTDIVEKRVEKIPPPTKKVRDFFDDDDEEEEKQPELKPLETPREERDTQHDAQSLSIATDFAASSESDDDSHRPSTNSGKPILKLNTDVPLPAIKPKEDSSFSSSSSTTTSEKSPKQQVRSSSFEKKQSPVHNDYDEDFSEVSHSPVTPTKEPLSKAKVVDIDVESIQEDLDDKESLHDTNQSLTSKSSADEQSEILVLVKKSANNTPRRQDDKTLEEEFLPPPPPLPQPKIESNNHNHNDEDTSHDVSDDDETNERAEQENKIDQLTDLFIKKFIDEAIDQGKQIERLKKEENHKKNILTKEVKEWILDDDDDSTDEESDKPLAVRHKDDDDHIIPITINSFAKTDDHIDDNDDLKLDLTTLDDKNSDERRIDSPRKLVIEEPVKPIVPHTREQVTQLVHQSIRILFNQNADFSDRSTIRCDIPNSYFTYDQQDSDNADSQRNHHAYCQLIFDLCIELLHEMYTENIQPVKYPEWQKTKLASKRFYRGSKPNNRHDIEEIIKKKILELLDLNSRQVIYSKYRVSNGRRNGTEKFETVLDEELRRAESQWVNYDDDCIQMKFDLADLIFEQLIQETLTECFHVIDKRYFLSSNNSTRL